MKYEMYYFYAKLSNKDFFFFRIGGAGLANNLFLYAKSLIHAHKYQGKVLRPSWEKISIGPILRGELDKRFYFGLFKCSLVDQMLKCFILLVARKIKVSDFHRLEYPKDGIRPILVVFDSLDGYFNDLRGYSTFILSHIEINAREHFLKFNKDENETLIGFHIRLGDFSNSMRIDMGWFVWVLESLQNIFAAIGKIKVVVFSDGSDAELTPLLTKPFVERSNGNSALSDLLLLSKVDLLVGSDSTFSGWAAYLGQMPSIFCKAHFDTPLEDSSKFLLVPSCSDDGFAALVNFIREKVVRG